MKRIFLDSVVLVLFLLTMSFQFLPKILHEVLGVLMLAAAVFHLIWNRLWFSSLLRGKWNFRSALHTLCSASTKWVDGKRFSKSTSKQELEQWFSAHEVQSGK